jgi:hypothetical protein
MKEKLITEIERLYALESGIGRLENMLYSMVNKQKMADLQWLIIEIKKIKRGEL